MANLGRKKRFLRVLLKFYRGLGAVCPAFSIIICMLFDEIVNDAYEEREYPALLALAREWEVVCPFDGLRVLVATPVFRNTLLEYRALIAGGADLVVGVAGGMPCVPGIVEALR